MPVNYDQFPTTPAGQSGPTDASKKTWAQVAAHALDPRNLGADWWNTQKQALAAIAASGQGELSGLPKGQLPSVDPVTMATNLVQHVMRDPQGSMKAVESIPSSIANYAQTAYGGGSQIKNTLYNHPYQPLADASGLLGLGASAMEGGEGAMADVPLYSKIMKGMQVASDVAGGPVNWGLRGAQTGAGAVTKAVRGQAFNPDGTWTTKGLAAVQQAHPGITQDVLDDPGFQASVKAATATKGVTVPAMRQAMLDTAGVAAPQSVVTGRKTPGPVQGTADAAVAQGRQTIGSKVAAITGGNPDPSVLGAALEGAHNTAQTYANGKYDALRQMPGSFGPTMDGTDLNAAIAKNLQDAGHPSTAALLDQSKGAYPEANRAMGLVNDALVNGKTVLGGDIDAPELMAVRRQLTDASSAAKGSDKSAVGAIMDGFNQHIENAANAGDFTVQTPGGAMASTEFPAALQDANSTYRAYKNTYQARQGAGMVVKNAVNKIVGSADQAGLTGDADVQQAAGGQLASALNNKNNGPATHAVLTNALGGPYADGTQALNDFVRGSATPIPESGDNAGTINTTKLGSFLNGPMADKVFSPDEQTQLRILGHADDVLSATRSQAAKTSLFGPQTLPWAAAAAGTGIGDYAGHVLGLPPGIGEAVGFTVGGLGEKAVDPLIQGARERTEMSGAPVVAGKTAALGNAASAALPAARLVPLVADANAIQSQPDNAAPIAPAIPSGPLNYDEFPTTAPDGQAAGGRVGYAAGGSTDGPSVDELVNRLMARSEKVKKTAKEHTKPLLKVPDNTVAKALSLAQGALA